MSVSAQANTAKDISTISEQAQYLDYVRILQSRKSNKASQSGITMWAIGAAIVYLAWQIIPLQSEIASKNLWHVTLFCTGHVMAAMLGAYHMMQSTNSSITYSPFDYRLTRNPTPHEALSGIIFLFLLLGVPATINVIALNLEDSIRDIWVVYRLNSYVLGGFTLIGAIGITITAIKRNVYGFSPFVGNNPRGSRTFFTLQMLFDFAQIVLLPANVYALYVTTSLLNPGEFSPVISVALNLSLILFCLVLLMKLDRSNRYSVFLEKLERDIVLHNLSAKEIKSRLEQEYLGRELGHWLGEQIDLLRNGARELTAYCDYVNQEINEIAAIDKTLCYERIGRFKAVVGGVESRVKALVSTWEPFQDWLHGAFLPAKFDQELLNLVQSTFSQLDELQSNAVATSKEALNRLKAFAESEHIALDIQMNN